MSEVKKRLKAELTNELTNILHYWTRYTIDTDYGGFVGRINYQNKVEPEAPKGAVLNARILWTFSSAYRATQKQEYFVIAQRAYEYIAKHFIDKKYGGVYWELSHDGKPVNTRKQTYAIAFAIYGLSEYYRVSNNEEARQMAMLLFCDVELNGFDSKLNGYFEAFSRDWQLLEDMRLSEKDANECKTMNTHLHILEAYTSLYRITKEEVVGKALKNLIELFLDKFINAKFTLNLFFNDKWELKSNITSFGHDIECSWLLYEAAELLNNKHLLAKVERVVLSMVQFNAIGLAKNGGLINELFLSDCSFDHDKHWWPQAEALVGYYNAYQLSGNKAFLSTVESVWDFIKKFIIDIQHGEWYSRVDQNNEPYMDEDKTGFWKCPYHNSRACMELMERIKV